MSSDQATQPEKRRPWSRSIRLAGDLISRWRRPALRIGLSGSAAAIAEAALLLLIGLVAAALAAGDTGETAVPLAAWRPKASITSLLLITLSLVAVRTVTTYDTRRALAGATATYEARLREGLLGAFLRADARRQAHQRSGELQELALSEVEAGATVLEAALHILPALISFLLLLATAFVVSPLASLVIVAGAVFLLLALQPVARRSRAATDSFTISRAAWAQELLQDQTLRHEISVFGVVPWVERFSNRLLAAVRRNHDTSLRVSSMALVLYQSTTYVIAVFLLLLFSAADMQAGGFAAVVLLFVRGLSYSQEVQHYLHIINERAGILERVEATVASLRAAEAPSGSTRGLDWSRLTFEDVWFSYDADQPALAGVSLDIDCGQMVGLIGASGAGKSTLAMLALGLLQPERGRVLVDGVPVQQIALGERSLRCAYVPQEPVLFELSVHDNIALGRAHIDESAVIEAAVRAGIHDEIARLPAGYHTVAAERGSRFSVGQRQRIAIARALAGKPRLVVFDEPTSALDPEAEAAVHRALAALRRDASVLVISHRRESALRCDRVLYLRSGRIVAEGSGAEMWELAGFVAPEIS